MVTHFPLALLATPTQEISFTLVCVEGDDHPSDAGYQTIANLVVDVSCYSRLRE
jgi:hypothetical protein